MALSTNSHSSMEFQLHINWPTVKKLQSIKILYPQMPWLIQMISGTLQQCFVLNTSVNFIFDPSVLQTKTFHLRIVCMCLVDSAFEMTLLSATNVTIKSPTQKLSKKINKKRKKERKKQKTNKQTKHKQTNK